MSAVTSTSSNNGFSKPIAAGAAEDPLIQLRLAYLRAVARSWRDADFRAKLTSAEDVQGLLQMECGLCVSWPCLDIRVRHSDPVLRWNPIQVGGWMGPDDEFEIALPSPPPVESHRPEALAAYYQRFPTLLGTALMVAQKQPQAMALVVAGSSGASGGSEVPTSAVLLPFGAVILRAIALSWADAEVREALLRESDARPVLSRFFGYNSPFNFRVRFAAIELAGDSFASLRNRILLNYPQVPAGPKALWPVALTAYNDTGAAYPFTC
jgi:ribosomally synthesized peptide (two-chain TOMM family)